MTNSLATRILGFTAILAVATPLAAQKVPDDLDRFVQVQMTQRRIPGLSLAILQDGRIIEARAYGVTDRGRNEAVQSTTLFQAGSISKSVAALGALHLVEQQKLSLDTDVNASLTTWKLPASEFTATKPVTLRALLSHTAGLTVHGFPGYAVDAPLPTLVQVLNGTSPANTGSIRNDAVPGTRWNYSGGGYTIMQQMMIDVTHQSFPDYMQRTVLTPLGMTHSSYEQPLPPTMARTTAAGHYPNGHAVKGRWHLYPEMAAAGLWTTPSDLLWFANEIQRSVVGKSNRVISQSLTREMLTDQKDRDGLGVFLEDQGAALRFGHNGRDEGFDALLSATVESGQGVAIMINANDNSAAVSRIRDFIAKKYHWPSSQSAYVAPIAVAVTPAELDAVAGRYEMNPNNMAAFIVDHGRLFISSDGMPAEEFIPIGHDKFASADHDARFSLVRDTLNAVTGFTWTTSNDSRMVPRIGPLFAALAAKPDLDPALTARIEVALRALGKGGDALTDAVGFTEGARKDFRNACVPAAGMRSIAFVTEENVGTRNIERHGGRVERIRYYRMTTEEGQLKLMVHLTSEGLVTDVDIVDE